jgi:tetratricopeptide (TPR) repeat protein
MSTTAGRIGVYLILIAAAAGGCSRQTARPMAFPAARPEATASDSLTVAAFIRLPSGEQIKRRHRADKLHHEAQDLVHYMCTFMDKSRYWDVEYHYHPREQGTGVTNCLHMLAEATRLDPTRVAAWLQQAELADGVGDWGEAARDLNRAMQALACLPEDQRPARRLEIALAQAWLCRERGLWAQGLDWVEEATSVHPGNQEALLVKGLLLAGAGRFAEACRAAMRLKPIEYPRIMWGMYGMSNNRSDYGSRWIRAMAYLALGDLELAYYALGPLNPHRQQIPFMNRYWNDVGRICELAGFEEESRVYYALAYLSTPHRYYFPSYGYSCRPVIFGEPKLKNPCWISYGRYYLTGSMFTYSSQVAAEYLASTDRSRREELGIVALEFLGRCVRYAYYPDLSRALRGRVYYDMEEYALAEDDLMAANLAFEQQGRNDAITSLLLGTLRVGRDQYAAALPYLQRAVAADSTLGAGWRNLGVAWIQVGDAEAGRRALNRSLELQPRSTIARYNRGLLNFQEGLLQEACLDLTIAAMLKPEDESITGLLTRVRKALSMAGGTLVGVEGLELDELIALSQPVGAAAESGEGGEESAAAGGSAEAGPGSSGALPGELAAREGRSEPDIGTSVYQYRDFSEEPNLLAGLLPAEASLDTVGYDRLIPDLVAAYEAEPSAGNRYRLSLAYVRSWRPEAALKILLPLWPDGLTAAEMSLVIEADRALGNTERALAAIQIVLEGTRLLPDPVYWSLVAFTLFESGYQREGFMALDVAIDIETTSASDDDLMLSSSSMVVGQGQADRLSALQSFREMHQQEVDMSRQMGGRGKHASEQAGGKGGGP